MTHEQRVTEAIYRAVDEINESRMAGQKLEKRPDTPLWDRSSRLDSLGLVSLIVATEMSLEEEFGVPVNLSEGALITHDATPLRNIGALAQYVSTLLAPA